MTLHTIYLLSPEIAVIAVALAIYLAGALVDAQSPLHRHWAWPAMGGLVVAGGLLWLLGGGPTDRSLALDPLAQYVRWLALGAGLMFLAMTSAPESVRSASDYVGSLLLAVAGLMLTASANDLVMLFVALELISIPTYVMLFLGRHDGPGREATTKYFYLSILSSAVLLYGLSFLYGTTGSTSLAAIGDRLAEAEGVAGPLGTLVKIALVLVVAGLGFRLAAVPFHFYAPDVYQGTSQANAAFLSVVPKAAALVALVRITVAAMPDMEPYGWRIVAALAFLTMTIGNVLALWQDNLRRLMAYSSIAHAGYMLIALAVALGTGDAVGGWNPVGAMLFYLSVYSLATVGLFAALTFLGHRGRQVNAVGELAGLARTRPLVAAMLAVFLFSLTGIPPLAGFWGKLLVFGSALGVDAGTQGGQVPWFLLLAVAGVVNAAVAATYYLRVAAVMYFRDPPGTLRAEGGRGSWLVAMTCAILVLGVGCFSGPLVRRSMDAGRMAPLAEHTQEDELATSDE